MEPANFSAAALKRAAWNHPPRSIFHTELEATNLCNTRCLHCPHEAISRPSGRMNWETFETVISKIRSHVKGRPYSVSFSGMGEPILNPLLFEFVTSISREAATSFASNGAALTEQNVIKLIQAGLDTVYVSFNGDEPDLFARMMGGLSFDRVLANIRRAVALSQGTRLKIRANVSITKTNQDKLERIKALLEEEGVAPVTLSLCHNRGSNLQDKAVCDTPVMDRSPWVCDVMKNTLFVDWRGRAHICDHDLHGEYELGDLMFESLETVLERRQRLLEDGSRLEICRNCNDIMRIGGAFPLESRSGGIFRDWIYYLYKDLDDPLSEASEPMKWIFKIYQKEGRTDRLANRLLEIEKATEAELQNERARKGALVRERDALLSELASVQGYRKEKEAFLADKQRIQSLLVQRDLEFAELHAEYCRIRRDRVWRLIEMLRRDFVRIRRLPRLIFASLRRAFKPAGVSAGRSRSG